MEVLLTRHGQTEWNVLGKVQGRADIELNEKGIQQAEETGEALKNEEIDLIICSPLKRAKQTAEIICKDRNIPIIYDEDVIERDFGEFGIAKVVCIGSDGKTMMPCGACMEYMMQLSEDSENIEILKKLENKDCVKLKELIPVWWGKAKL